MAEGLLKYLLYADTLLLQIALGVMLGALASVVWLLRSSSPWARAVTRRSQWCLMVGGVVALVADVAMLWLQSAVMSDGSLADAGSMVPMMLNETHFGLAWKIGVGALLLATVASASLGRLALCFAVVGTGVFALTRSVVSHAGSSGDFTAQVGVDWFHLLLTSLWVGMVLVGAAVALRTAMPDSQDRGDAQRWIESLSQAATVALIGIVFTGALKVWWVTPSWGQLVASTYGAVLLVKVLLVGGAVALGGFNRFRVMPDLTRRMHAAGAVQESFHQRFAYILWVEAAVLFCVVLAAAVLSGTPTPGEG